MILAGDVGGTKILLEVGQLRTGRWEPAFARRFEDARFAAFPTALAAFLAEWNATRARRDRVTAAAFGVAGPVIANRVKMTNLPWVVDGAAIARRFGIPKVRVVNDLAAMAHGIDALGTRELRTLQRGKASDAEPRVVLGVGTGLGIAFSVPTGAGLREVAGEGGHAGFAPATEEQAALWRSIFAAEGHVSAESILSGQGIRRIHAFLWRTHGKVGKVGVDAAPEEITQAALEGDPICGATLDLFVDCLGNVAGDHALALMARGGVYLAGGIVAKFAARMATERFRAAFRGKSPHAEILARIPVRAVTSERVALLGAARFASEL